MIDLAQSRAARSRSVVSVRRAQSPAKATFGRRTRVVAAYVEDDAGRAALRIATEGAALRGASLRVLDPISRGDVGEELLRESRNVDLLVIGSGCDRGSGTLHFDSVARTLSHRAECPVMFVPSGVERIDVSDIVCGVDRSNASAAALRWAAHEAAMRGGMVLAQQVQSWADGYRTPTQSLSGWVLAQQIEEPTTIMCRLAPGMSVAADLVHVAAGRGAMIVVGSHRSDGGQLHRCVPGRLAGHTPVPVVVVPPEIPAPRRPPGT